MLGSIEQEPYQDTACIAAWCLLPYLNPLFLPHSMKAETAAAGPGIQKSALPQAPQTWPCPFLPASRADQTHLEANVLSAQSLACA